MNEIAVQVLSDATNFIVLVTPGRSFPGMVIQGDSLRAMHRLAERIRPIAVDIQDEDLRDDINDLCDRLRERVEAYEAVLNSYGMLLPYPDRFVTSERAPHPDNETS